MIQHVLYGKKSIKMLSQAMLYLTITELKPVQYGFLTSYDDVLFITHA